MLIDKVAIQHPVFKEKWKQFLKLLQEIVNKEQRYFKGSAEFSKMIPKCVCISVVFLVAICGAVGNEECAEERAFECQEKLLELFFGDSTEEETCGALYGVSKCLRNVADDCLGEEKHPDVEEALKEFEDALNKNCGETSEGDDDEIGNCLEENKDYLLQCIIDEETGEISKLLDIESMPDDISLDFVKCYLYGLMGHCVVSRSTEKCGEAAGELALNEMNDMPSSIQESCDSQQDNVEASLQEFFSLNLLDQKKKRDLGNRKKRSLEYVKKRALEYKK
ncbi:hypothetical protein JTE90_011952 [Oedothorax gibbosus]|uniref:Uncharacterized protein n=1 Tax=Oedothorax gibbosus TaxID=931172 RepID=A0AAV6V3K5_9ARAC|nr:hypothetical protein JTE90_011952 [Oedothorax gibbosus]